MADIRILKFEADWCSPCQTQAQLLEDFDAAPVETIDVDEQEDVAEEYDVRGIPMLVVEEDGEEVERFSGVTQPGELGEAVDRNS